MRDEILKYGDNEMRFHMPGHSGVDLDGALYSVAKYDITELSWSDNLAHPTGALRELSERVARAYGTRKTLILTEGATAGIQTALLIAREERDVLYLVGETHKSCISFASIIGLKVVQLDSMSDAIEMAREGAFIYVTSPNYYGMVTDISALLDARDKGSIVIVDEAHGAHFPFSSLLPESVASRADIAVESLHKTLPVFTGGAVLCVNNERYLDMAEFMKCKIHSTSPSYLIMHSIEYAIDMMTREGEALYREVHEDIERFKASLGTDYSVAETDDFTRLVVVHENAESVNRYLEAHGVYIELSNEHRLVFIVTPANSKKLDKVVALLNAYRGDAKIVAERGEMRFDLERARGTEGRLMFLPLSEAEGKVSMNEIAIYPPGVPIVAAGDILTKEVLDYIDENREKIVGLIGDTIAVRELCEEN